MNKDEEQKPLLEWKKSKRSQVQDKEVAQAL